MSRCNVKTAHKINIASFRKHSHHSHYLPPDDTIIFRAYCLSCNLYSYILEKDSIEAIVYKENIPDDNQLSWGKKTTKIQAGDGSDQYIVNIIKSQRVVEPDIAFGVPPVNPDLNEQSKSLYNEAASIMNKSPRSAVALLRLSLEIMLKKDFDLKKGSIYQRLGKLYKAGIPKEIETALQYVRIAGNAADHPDPGKILLDGKYGQETARTLLNIINLIVNYKISIKKKLNSLTDCFTPEQKKSIEKLHKKNKN